MKTGVVFFFLPLFVTASVRRDEDDLQDLIDRLIADARIADRDNEMSDEYQSMEDSPMERPYRYYDEERDFYYEPSDRTSAGIERDEPRSLEEKAYRSHGFSRKRYRNRSMKGARSMEGVSSIKDTQSLMGNVSNGVMSSGNIQQNNTNPLPPPSYSNTSYGRVLSDVQQKDEIPPTSASTPKTKTAPPTAPTGRNTTTSTVTTEKLPKPTAPPTGAPPSSTTPTLSTSVSPTTNYTQLDIMDWVKEYREFTCPSLELVLQDVFRGFPRDVANMTWDLDIKLEDFTPFLKQAESTYNFLKDVRLTLEQLIEAVGRVIITERMNCPATKFQQAIMYVLEKNIQEALRASHPGSLYTRLWHDLLRETSIKSNRVFIIKLIHAVQRELFKEVTRRIQNKMFPQVEGLLERTYFEAVEYYLKHKSFPDADELRQILNDSIKIHPKAFRCTSMQKVLHIHHEEMTDLQDKHYNDIYFWGMMRPIIQELFDEYYPDASNVDPARAFMSSIKDYSGRVIQQIQTFLSAIDKPTSNKAHDVFKGLLSSYLLKDLQMIVDKLKAGPTNMPDWALKVLRVLHRLKQYHSDPLAHPSLLKNIIQTLEGIIDPYE